MYENRKRYLPRQAKPYESGDTAVDGLFSGMLAGLMMEFYLTISGLLSGLSLGDSLTRLSPTGGTSPASGLLLHFAVSGIYGIVFGLTYRWVVAHIRQEVPGWLAGLLFGIGLFTLAELFILPQMASGLQDIPWIHFLIAHLVYGSILGINFRRLWNK